MFPAEDVRLLSTVATHTAIVLANARFFDLIRRAKEQWEIAFDALSEGIAVVDDSGRIRRANRALAGLLGGSVSTVIGKELGPGLLGQGAGLDELLAAARRNERPLPFVARSPHRARTFRVNAARIPTSTREQSVVVLIEDVTDQQVMEANLVQSEKLAAVGQLVSGVAHELNNPLTSIAGLSEFLLEQKELGTKDRGHLRVIHEQADRAGTDRGQPAHLRPQGARGAGSRGSQRRDPAYPGADELRPEAQGHRDREAASPPIFRRCWATGMRCSR